MRNTLALLAIATGLQLPMTQGQTTSDALRIFTAIEVEFGTETNKYYTLQGSADMQTWRDIGEPIFGNGQTVSRAFSARTGEVSFDFYRLSIVQATNVSFVPWSLSGLSIWVSDDGSPETLQFTSDTIGVEVEGLDRDAFTYTFTNISENDLRAELRFANGDREVYSFTFASATQGNYVREEFRGTVLRDRDLGIFRILSETPPGGGGNPPQEGELPIPAEPPAALTGFAFLFHTGASPDRLEFTSATAGFELEDNGLDDDDNGSKPFTYTYTLAGTNATLVVELPDSRRDEYDLTFTEGAQGRFIRREFRNGALDDTDTGTFSPTSIPAPTTGNGGPGGGGGTPIEPPATIVGDLFTINTGTTPDRLEILTATNGRETDEDGDIDGFTYTYTVNEGRGVLVATREPGRSDTYEFTFTSPTGGSFVRREVRNGVLDDTDNGTFTRVPATP